MRRVLHEGQTPRPLQEKATRKSCPQSSHRARAKPWAKMPLVALPVKLACAGQLKPGLLVLGHGLVQQGAFGVVRVVEFGFGGL